ncbi:MAG: hypothetical protein AB1758_09700 [Candidatus Eremiobacterota bacterium]
MIRPLAAAVALGVAAAAVEFTPVSLRRGRPGEDYRVGPVRHRMPDLDLGDQHAFLLKPWVLADMRDLLERTEGILDELEIPHWITTGTLLGAMPGTTTSTSASSSRTSHACCRGSGCSAGTASDCCPPGRATSWSAAT